MRAYNLVLFILLFLSDTHTNTLPEVVLPRISITTLLYALSEVFSFT